MDLKRYSSYLCSYGICGVCHGLVGCLITADVVASENGGPNGAYLKKEASLLSPKIRISFLHTRTLETEPKP